MIIYLGENLFEKINVGIRCKYCKKLQIFEVSHEQWKELLNYLNKNSVMTIHEILHNIDSDIRENFISGICGKCFNKIYKDSESVKV